MRVLIVTPAQSRETGNRVTAERHRAGLEERGHQVRIVEAGGEIRGLPAEILARAEIVHLLHAFRSGKPWLGLAGAAAIPFVVTLTGTDIHQGIGDPGQAPVIREVLRRAAAVITQNRLTFDAWRDSGEEFASRLRYLPPAILLGSTPYPLRQRLGISPHAPLFLHPAGIRPVKGNLELLSLLDPLAVHPDFRAVFCGPILDHHYGERFIDALEPRSWAAWTGTLPPETMTDVLRQADVVLNHSESEGLPNALLEAAAVGCPILARDIPGNAAVVEPGVNGFLYTGEADFHRRARALRDDLRLRQRLSRPRPDLADPGRETEALLAIYREALKV